MIAATPTSLSAGAQTLGGAGSSATRTAATTGAAASAASASSATAKADAQLAAEKDALSRLKAVSASASASPSELAKAKLNALKERLKMLMMMGGDPKTVAKEAAQIAKQIGEAAKAYADSAGGSDSGAAAEASSATATAQQDAASAQSAAQAGASQDAAAPATTGPAPAGPKATDISKPDAKDGGASTTDQIPADPAKTQTPDKTQTQGQTTVQPSLPHGAVVAAKSKLPDPVIEEARVLEASAKAIAKAAIEKLKAQHRTNPDAKTEQANLDEGQKDFDTAAKEIYGDTGVPGGGSDASTSYAADGSAAAAPADASLVSIKA